MLPKNLGYDYTKDFAPLGLVTSTATMLAVTPSVRASNLKEFTQMRKASPDKYQYSACDMTSLQHFSMEMYKHALNLGRGVRRTRLHFAVVGSARAGAQRQSSPSIY